MRKAYRYRCLRFHHNHTPSLNRAVVCQTFFFVFFFFLLILLLLLQLLLRQPSIGPLFSIKTEENDAWLYHLGASFIIIIFRLRITIYNRDDCRNTSLLTWSLLRCRHAFFLIDMCHRTPSPLFLCSPVLSVNLW